MAAQMEFSALGQSNAARIIQNPVLLQKIAKHLPVQTMLHLRGTCVEWNKTFLPEIKKLHTPVKIFSYFTNPLEREEQKLRRFIGEMLESKGIPFSKYRIGPLPLLPSKLGETELLDFFTKFGSSITSLELDPEGIDWTRRILYEFTPELRNLTMRPLDHASELPLTLPKLKRLHFHPRPPDPMAAEGSPAEGLGEILEQAVHLQSLELSLDYSAHSSTILRILQDLTCVHKLKILNISVRPAMYGIIRNLTNLSAAAAHQLRLDRLTAAVDFDSSQHGLVSDVLSAFDTFLATQSANLRQLEIVFTQYPLEHPEQDRDIFHVPKMDTVTTFNLDREEHWNFEFEGDATLGAAFPALKRFEFSDSTAIPGEGHMTMEELSQLRHEGVTDLTWNANPNLAALRLWFPAVTRVELEIGADNQGELVMLWNNWPALQSVHIKWGTRYGGDRVDLDQLLTGIQKPELDLLEDDRDFYEIDPAQITMDNLSWLQGRYKTRFGIGDQKCLQTFTLEIKNFEAVELSDIGGYFGLAFASQSVEFQFEVKMEAAAPSGGREEPWISEGCLSFVQKTLGPFAFIKLIKLILIVKI